MTTTRTIVPNFLVTVGSAIQFVMSMFSFLSTGNMTELFLEFLDFACELGVVLPRLLPFLVGVSFLVGRTFCDAVFPILMAIQRIVR